MESLSQRVVPTERLRTVFRWALVSAVPRVWTRAMRSPVEFGERCTRELRAMCFGARELRAGECTAGKSPRRWRDPCMLLLPVPLARSCRVATGDRSRGIQFTARNPPHPPNCQGDKFPCPQFACPTLPHARFCPLLVVPRKWCLTSQPAPRPAAGIRLPLPRTRPTITAGWTRGPNPARRRPPRETLGRIRTWSC